ncbi:MAG: ribonuclease H-like domain-containing protein, partial [Vulcanimicrobiaceae bacterium]
MISADSYGLKAVERFYNVSRATAVKAGGDSIVEFERWLLEGTPSILADIENYNRDDCRSTFLLREWLLERRPEAIEFRPVKAPDAPCHLEYVATCKKCQTRQKEEREEKRRSALERALGAREDASAQLLAHLVAYHRREDKPVWWAYFDRCDNVDRLFEFDKEAIARLTLRDDKEPYKLKSRDTNLVYTYAFPDQQHKMKAGAAHDPRTQISGEIIEIDDEQNLLYLKRGGSLDEARATAELIPPGPRKTDAQREALVRIGELFQSGRLADDFPATLDLLTACDPRTSPRRRVLQPERVSAQSILEGVRALDSSYLFIQGPPGSGKTTYGSQMICDLLAEGKRVAVMSTGHKANHNMLQKVEECMQKRGRRFKGLYKHSGEESAYQSLLDAPMITSVDKNDLFEAGDYELAGGT